MYTNEELTVEQIVANLIELGGNAMRAEHDELVELAKRLDRPTFNRDAESVMYDADSILNTHGVLVEKIDRGVWHYDDNVKATYLNTGDQYNLTLIHEEDTGKFLFTTIADYRERKEAP